MSDDNVGRPRVQAVVERDERVLELVRQLGAERGVRVGRLATELGIKQSLVVHALNRLRRESKVVRRDGYAWWPTTE